MDQLKNIPAGRPKSGRVWKEKKNRFSEMRVYKTLKTSWGKKMALKAERKSVKEFEKQLKDDRNKKLEDKRLRAAEKKKRQEENARKSEIVQPIKDTAKIKRMKKKQLKQIEKR